LAFQRTHYWTPKIQDGGDPPSWKSTTSFFCRGRSDLDKILQTDAEWHVDCGDIPVVEIETGSRIPIWLTLGQIQWHVIPEPCVTLQSAATWRIQCDNPRATCYIRPTWCCHRRNSMKWSQCYVPHCRVLPPAKFNVMSSQSHVPHCRVKEFHPPYWKTVLRHILFFLMQFGLWRGAAFVSSSIHLFTLLLC